MYKIYTLTCELNPKDFNMSCYPSYSRNRQEVDQINLQGKLAIRTPMEEHSCKTGKTAQMIHDQGLSTSGVSYESRKVARPVKCCLSHTYTRNRGICLEIRRVNVGASGRQAGQFRGAGIQETLPGGLANNGNWGRMSLSNSTHTSSKEAESLTCELNCKGEH